MSISGGGNSATYYVSLRYTKDQGLLNVDGKNNFNNNINLQTYQMRANVNINVTKTTQVRVNLSGIFDTYEGPIYSESDIYKMVMKSNPVLFPLYILPMNNINISNTFFLETAMTEVILTRMLKW